MWGMLSRYRREIASVFRYSTAVASSMAAVDAGLRAEGGESPCFLLELAQCVEMIEAIFKGFASAEGHGCGGLHSQGVCGAVDGQAVVEGVFLAAREGVEASFVEGRDCVVNR